MYLVKLIHRLTARHGILVPGIEVRILVAQLNEVSYNGLLCVTLDHKIGVRIPVPQQRRFRKTSWASGRGPEYVNVRLGVNATLKGAVKHRCKII